LLVRLASAIRNASTILNGLGVPTLHRILSAIQHTLDLDPFRLVLALLDGRSTLTKLGMVDGRQLAFLPQMS
jgi:hypothetical protein